jgi:serine/threonine protein kinase
VGLDHAHGKGLVHGGLKPSNVLLHGGGRSPVVKVGDYGLAKAFAEVGLGGDGGRFGGPEFMPRQQAERPRDCKPEVDVWAAAATLYHLLTGAFPRDFPRDEPDRHSVVLSTPPVPLRRRHPAAPEKLAALIDRALCDDPAIPFQTAADFGRALEGVL